MKLYTSFSSTRITIGKTIQRLMLCTTMYQKVEIKFHTFLMLNVNGDINALAALAQ